MTRVVVNGCFDLLHRGHLDLLKYARQQGDIVLVLIDSDRQVAEFKGHNRPVNNQEDRKYLLESLKYVNEVKIFDTQEQLVELIEQFRPDIMIKGDEYKGTQIPGEEFVREIKFFKKTEHSTTKTIQRITDRR